MDIKTFKECCDEIAKKYWSSFKNTLVDDERIFNNIIESEKIDVLKEAAELYAAEVAHEKDEEIKKLTEQLEKLLLGDLTSAANRFFIVREKVKEAVKLARENNKCCGVFNQLPTDDSKLEVMCCGQFDKYTEYEILEKLKL